MMSSIILIADQESWKGGGREEVRESTQNSRAKRAWTRPRRGRGGGGSDFAHVRLRMNGEAKEKQTSLWLSDCWLKKIEGQRKDGLEKNLGEERDIKRVTTNLGKVERTNRSEKYLALGSQGYPEGPGGGRGKSSKKKKKGGKFRENCEWTDEGLSEAGPVGLGAKISTEKKQVRKPVI